MKAGNLGFGYKNLKSGDVLIDRNGKMVTTLRGKKAVSFTAKMDELDFSGQQQMMARITGNYKRGNEKSS